MIGLIRQANGIESHVMDRLALCSSVPNRFYLSTSSSRWSNQSSLSLCDTNRAYSLEPDDFPLGRLCSQFDNGSSTLNAAGFRCIAIRDSTNQTGWHSSQDFGERSAYVNGF